MYKSVVIPLDGSRFAEAAIPYGIALARRLSFKVKLLSVVENQSPHFRIEAEKYLVRTIIGIKQFLDTSDTSKNPVAFRSRVLIETAVLNGSPAEQITEYTNSGSLKLLVMATHGRSGIGRWTIGSVADKVVRTTTRQPTVLIRCRGAQPKVRIAKGLKKILVPLDGSMLSSAIISYISEIARLFDSELRLLQVVPENGSIFKNAENYLTDLCDGLKAQGYDASHEVRIGSPAETIINVAEKLKADMVAMSTRGQGGFYPWVLGSVASKIINGGTTPLMLIKE
ncbi:universal stress protein [Chloroflexota bacterium]